MRDSIFYDLCKVDATNGVVSVAWERKWAIIVLELASPITSARENPSVFHPVTAFSYLPAGQDFRFEGTERCRVDYLVHDDHMGSVLKLSFLNEAPTKEQIFSTVNVVRGESESWSVSMAKLERFEEILGDKSSISEGMTSFAWAKLKMGRIGIRLAPMLSDEEVRKTACGGDLGKTVDHELLLASFGGQMDEVKDLLARGANVNAVYLPSPSRWTRTLSFLRPQNLCIGSTPLMYAIPSGSLPLIQLLVERGARLDMINSYRQTALDLAVLKEDREIVKYLVSLKAPLSSTTPADLTRILSSEDSGHRCELGSKL